MSLSSRELANSSDKSLTEAEEKCFSKSIYLLQHCTSRKNLPDILKSGKLLPRAQQDKPNHGTGSGQYVYLAPYNEDGNIVCLLSSSSRGDGGQGDLNQAALMFSVNLLSRDDYHYSGCMNYGRTEGALMAAQFKSAGYPIAPYGEVCFRNEINFDYLIAIWVHPLKLEATKNQLKQLGLTQYTDKIKSYYYSPRITLTDDYHLQITPRNCPPPKIKAISTTYEIDTYNPDDCYYTVENINEVNRWLGEESVSHYSLKRQHSGFFQNAPASQTQTPALPKNKRFG